MPKDPAQTSLAARIVRSLTPSRLLSPWASPMASVTLLSRRARKGAARPLAALACGITLTASALAALSQVPPAAQAASSHFETPSATPLAAPAAIPQGEAQLAAATARPEIPDALQAMSTPPNAADELLQDNPATALPIAPARPTPPVSPARAPAKAAPKTRTMWMEVTAYCACTKCCGDDARGITASGKTVRHNRGRFVAADTRLLPFGTKLSIPGYHGAQTVEVIDRGKDIKGNRLDVFFPNHKTAKEWGRRWVKVTVTAK